MEATGDSFFPTVSELLHEVSEISAFLSTCRSEHEGPMLLELVTDIKVKNELLSWIVTFCYCGRVTTNPGRSAYVAELA